MADDADEAFQQGQQLAERGAWQEALVAYEHAVALDKSHWKCA